ncbi:hypothetical protein BXZ70DRAFT_736298 [Cristinia sonorae]|uniref:Uncharacterized protein n=1 Tax=Cristinia sonorae TaxID=1940300 RepID=A0A8K0USX0_9AGAR|nr:hypothetical protein BXZ70DRAFT_736298 [Cristinia sonorae]
MFRVLKVFVDHTHTHARTSPHAFTVLYTCWVFVLYQFGIMVPRLWMLFLSCFLIVGRCLVKKYWLQKQWLPVRTCA